MLKHLVGGVSGLLLAAAGFWAWQAFNVEGPPQPQEDAVSKFLKSVRLSQAKTDEELNRTLEFLRSQQERVIACKKPFIDSRVALFDAHRRVKAVGEELPGVIKELEKADADNTIDHFGPRMTLAQLQASLSVYGITYDANHSLGKLALKLPDEIIQMAELGKRIRDQRTTWFSGAEALRETIGGLVRLRNGNDQALSTLENSAKAVDEQHRQDLVAIGGILEAVKELLLWSRDATAAKAATVQRFADWMNQTVQPALKATLDSSKSMAGIPPQAAYEKKLSGDSTVILDALLKEIQVLEGK